MGQYGDILKDDEATLKGISSALIDDEGTDSQLLSDAKTIAADVLNASISEELSRDGGLLRGSALSRVAGRSAKYAKDLPRQMQKRYEAEAAQIEFEEGFVGEEENSYNKTLLVNQTAYRAKAKQEGGNYASEETSSFEGADKNNYLKNIVRKTARGIALMNFGGKVAEGQVEDIEDEARGKVSQKTRREVLERHLKRARAKSAVKKRAARNAARAAKSASVTSTVSRVGATTASQASTVAKAPHALALAPVGFLPAIALVILVSIIFALLIEAQNSSANLEALSATEQQVARYLFDKGFDDIHVAAIMGNMRVENGGVPGDEFDAGSLEVGSGAGHGLCQWTGSRWQSLRNYAIAQGLPWTNLGLQLDFFWTEYESYATTSTRRYTVSATSDDPVYPTVVSGSKGGFEEATDVATATKEFCYFYEAPGIPHESLRIEYAQTYLAWFRSTDVSGWVFPLPDGWVLSSDYGPRGGSTHEGVDFAATSGTPIYAASAGTVSFAGWYGSGGYTVIIDHGSGLTTLYMHMSSISATQGSAVSAGDVIGYVGSTGNSSGPHLHFQVELNGTSQDPSNYISY